MSDRKPPCAICRGAYEEHGPGKTQHVYTETPGQLKSQEQELRERMMGQQGSQRMVVLPTPPNENEVLRRLIQKLLEKEVISQEEALEMYGINTPKQQYADPGRMM